jgi:phage terminase large subunit-like protein
VIVRVEKIDKDLARCIEVDSEDHTYIVSNYTVTHNSVCGAYELSCHLTGNYPAWWTGRRFETPIEAWAVGKDARAVRDTAQKELLGAIGEWGTGMLPAHTLGKFCALQGTPQAIDLIQVRHKSGGWSRLGFKNYQQDIGSFMGTSRHCVWMDEECPLDIYNECNIRTATVDGIIMVTFTPLEGLTSMVVNFCKNADFLMGARPVVTVDIEDEDMSEGEFVVGQATSKAVVQAGWDDAPWLSDKMKQRLLEDTPLHLRDARTKGTPAMGSGNVYPVPLEQVIVDPFDLPAHWPRMYALDVGWNRTACVWGALDPNSDTLYLYDEHYLGKELPAVHAYAIRSRGDWINGVIDPASRGRSQTDGNKLIINYKDLGLIIYPAKNQLESGILTITQRLVAGKLKIFKTLINLQREYLLYRRDKHGKVIPENDHALDCVRYIVNNLNRMASSSEALSNGGIKYAPRRYDI